MSGFTERSGFNSVSRSQVTTYEWKLERFGFFN